MSIVRCCAAETVSECPLAQIVRLAHGCVGECVTGKLLCQVFGFRYGVRCTFIHPGNGVLCAPCHKKCCGQQYQNECDALGERRHGYLHLRVTT
jgi:hypothetical protein